MKKRAVVRMGVALVAAVMLSLCAAGLVACGEDSSSASAADATAGEGRRPLLVATAASLKLAFTEIGTAFDTANGSETTFTFDASGSLQKQIEAGAPVDVFVSASPVQVDNLLEQGLVDQESVTAFAGNEMVLAVPASSTLTLTGFKDLAKAEVKKITTADPQTAPQGKTAVEVLTSLGLLSAVEPKLIYAKNASQTLTYVIEGEVDAGIMFATDAIGGGDAVKVVEISDPSWHSTISYVMAVVSASQAKSLGQQFMDFVTGPEGRSILEKHGFVIP